MILVGQKNVILRSSLMFKLYVLSCKERDTWSKKYVDPKHKLLGTLQALFDPIMKLFSQLSYMHEISLTIVLKINKLRLSKNKDRLKRKLQSWDALFVCCVAEQIEQILLILLIGTNIFFFRVCVCVYACTVYHIVTFHTTCLPTSM